MANDVIDSTNVGSLLQGIFTKIKNAFWQKSEVAELPIDATPTANSNNLVKSGGVYSALSGKQDTVVFNTAYNASSNKAATMSDIPSVPVTDVTVGGTSVVSSGTAAIPSIPTVPTIVTDIAANKTSTTTTASPSGVYAEVHPAIATTQPQGGFLPNVVYDLGTITDTTFALATPSDATIANAYFWTFETGSTAPTINWPNGVTWAGGSAPTVNASCHYEILIRNGYGTALEFDIS